MEETLTSDLVFLNPISANVPGHSLPYLWSQPHPAIYRLPAKNLYDLNEKERNALLVALGNGNLIAVPNPNPPINGYKAEVKKRDKEDLTEEWEYPEDQIDPEDPEWVKEWENPQWEDCESLDGSDEEREIKKGRMLGQLFVNHLLTKESFGSQIGKELDPAMVEELKMYGFGKRRKVVSSKK